MASSTGPLVTTTAQPASTPDAYRTLTTGYAGPSAGGGTGGSNCSGSFIAASPAAPVGNISTGMASMTLEDTAEERVAHVDSDMAIDGKMDDEFICSICTFVMREPQLVVKCGHHFCRGCLEKYRSTRSECALCRGVIASSPGEVVPDLSLARRINDVSVKCESADLGCTWTGSIRDYNDHCANGECKVICPNKCGENLSRAKIDEHLNNACPKTIIFCKFARVGTGCKTKMHRMDLADHLRVSMLDHQLLLVQSVDMLTANVWTAACTPNQERNTTFTWVFTDFKKYLDGSKNRLFSEPFYVGPCDSGYRLVLRVETGYQEDAISTFYCVAKGKNDDRLEWPFKRPVTFQALHSSSHKVMIQDRSMPPTRDESIRLITARPKTERNKRGWGRATFVPFKRLDEVGVRAANSFVLRIIVPWAEMGDAK